MTRRQRRHPAPFAKSARGRARRAIRRFVAHMLLSHLGA